MSSGKVKAKRINDARFSGASEIVSVTQSIGRLTVTVGGPDGVPHGSIDFREVIGVRVLMEGDLLEFWPVCSGQGVGLFRITEGGWFDQESLRDGFISGETRKGLIMEFFITGSEDCVSILAFDPPIVSVN